MSSIDTIRLDDKEIDELVIAKYKLFVKNKVCLVNKDYRVIITKEDVYIADIKNPIIKDGTFIVPDFCTKVALYIPYGIKILRIIGGNNVKTIPILVNGDLEEIYFEGFNNLENIDYLFSDIKKKGPKIVDFSGVKSTKLRSAVGLFQENYSVTSFKFSDSMLKSIKDFSYAFFKCSMKSVSLRDLNALNYSHCFDKSKVRRVTMPKNIKNMTNISYMFANSTIETLEFTEGVYDNLEIAYNCFENCKHLTSLSLKNVKFPKVTDISYFLKGISNLRELVTEGFYLDNVLNVNHFIDLYFIPFINVDFVNWRKVESFHNFIKLLGNSISVIVNDFDTSSVSYNYCRLIDLDSKLKGTHNNFFALTGNVILSKERVMSKDKLCELAKYFNIVDLRSAKLGNFEDSLSYITGARNTDRAIFVLTGCYKYTPCTGGYYSFKRLIVSDIANLIYNDTLVGYRFYTLNGTYDCTETNLDINVPVTKDVELKEINGYLISKEEVDSGIQSVELEDYTDYFG